jgi:ABC-type Fe3+-hydroxamate transport system substrate-binding protein
MPYFSFITCCLFIVSHIIFYSCNEKKIPHEKNIPVKRIISLSPSITGQIIDLDLEDKLVGVTPHHPPLKRDLPLVGTFINPSIEKIISLEPDIIFYSEEDGDVQSNDFFKKFGLKHYKFSRNNDFRTICNNYLMLSAITGKKEYGENKVAFYTERLKEVRKENANIKVAFLVSVKPLVTVSKHSYITNIINDAGGINIFSEAGNPYPILTVESLVIKNPDVVIIMHEGEDVYLFNQLKCFKNLNFIIKKNIFVAGDDVIPYYSPKEYILAVKKISEILSQMH